MPATEPLTEIPKRARPDPMLVRVVPFMAFVGLTACQGQFGEASRYWFYAAKTFLGAGLLWFIYPHIREMRWQMSWDAVVVGLAVFGLWVGLDGLYPSSGALARVLLCPVLKPLGLASWCSGAAVPPAPWNPHTQFGLTVAWGFAIVRLIGSTVIVPPFEETFYRSFLYRYLVRPDFEAVPLNAFLWKAFLITSVVFGFVHVEWLPGILCGMFYQALVLRHGRLGPAMSAHAITNFLLGVWVIWRGAWHFW